MKKKVRALKRGDIYTTHGRRRRVTDVESAPAGPTVWFGTERVEGGAPEVRSLPGDDEVEMVAATRDVPRRRR